MNEKTELNNEKGKLNFDFKNFILEYNSVLIFVILLIISASLSPMFLSKQNIFNIFRQQTTYILVSIGVLLTILTGGLDLSVSSIAGVGSIMVAMALTNWGLGLIPAILIAILVGILIGVFNGICVSILKMPAVIVTLATWISAEGLAYFITNGAPIRLETRNSAASAALVNFGQGFDSVLGLPKVFYLAILFLVIFYIIMKYTAFGRLVKATGSNKKAVRLAGINVKKYTFLVYVISGALSAVAGIIVSAQTSIATPMTASTDFNLTAVAACVIGGASLNGGKGTVLLTLVGVFIMALITNVMNLLSVPAYPQMIAKGLIIIFAVLLNGFSEKDSV